MANFDDIAPKVQIKISGTAFGDAALEYITSVKVEQALDKCDQISLDVSNPVLDQVKKVRSSALVFTDSMAFMPGNTIEVFLGYGKSADTFIGAGVVRKYMPDFPETGMPMLQIKALDGGCLLMDGNADVFSMQARKFDTGMTLYDMALSVVSSYGFETDKMVATGAPTPSVLTIKKAGMSDYAFLRGLANMLGYEFRIGWNQKSSQWSVYWRPPQKDETKKKTFTWGPDFAGIGEGGILLSFAPEFAIQGAPSDIEIYYFDRDTRTWEKITYPKKPPKKGSKKSKPTFQWKGDATTAAAELASAKDPETGRGLRIAAGGLAVEVIPTQNFNSAEEAGKWAEAWFKARQDLLIQGSGRIIGYPDLRPGQVQTFQGIGEGLSGDWFITECTHSYTQGSGYICEFRARKVIV